MVLHKGKISEIIEETPHIKLFKVTLENGVFDYKPGQFAMLSLDNVKTETGILVKRSYSIASSPTNKEYLEFCVSIKKDGKLSPQLEKLKHGDSMNLDGPYGRFNLKDPLHAGTIVFIAGGAGIAPLLSMIRTLLVQHNDIKILLLYGFRNPEDCSYKDELLEYSKKYKNFNMYRTVSSKEVPEWWEEDTGRVTAILNKYIKPKEIECVYICGNPDMVRDTIDILKAAGIPEAKIYNEQW